MRRLSLDAPVRMHKMLNSFTGVYDPERPVAEEKTMLSFWARAYPNESACMSHTSAAMAKASAVAFVEEGVCIKNTDVRIHASALDRSPPIAAPSD
jgi:hypothetical protein